MEKPRVLVVEDKQDIREMRAELLATKGYRTEVADGIDQAMTLFRKNPYPVVVTDLNMEGIEDGLEVARQVRATHPGTKVIIITGTDHRKAAVDGYRVNVFEYVEKGRATGRRRLIEAVARAFEVLQEDRVKKYMLSFLTHTMRNTFAGAEPALEEALESSGALAAKLDADQRVYQMISNLAFLRTSLATVDSMLDAYKLLVREPENLRQGWEADAGGESNLGQVLDAAVGAALSRLFCQEAQIPTLKRLAASRGVENRKALKQQYLSDHLLAEEDGRESAIDWLAENFPVIKVVGREPRVSLNRSGLRFSLLFAVVSEIFFNAIKYSDGRQPIKIRWRTQKEHHELNIKNTCNVQSTNEVGSKEGRNFISTLLSPLDGLAVEFLEAEQNEGLFEAKLMITKNLLDGEQRR